MSRVMRKPAIYIGENKGAAPLFSLLGIYLDDNPLLHNAGISSL